MKEAALLRTLADKLDELDAVSHFPTDITDPGELAVTWSAGNDHPGYESLNEAIGALVKQHWNALRAQVIKQRDAEVQQARAAWSAAVQNAPAISGPVSAAEGSALRKVVG